jgi:aconitate hydratase
MWTLHWAMDRAGADKQEKNNCTFFLIVTSKEQMVIQTHAFVTSPEMVAALAIAGRLDFNPLTDTLLNDREEVKLTALWR